MNSHLLSLFISYRSSGEKLIKYQANSSCVIMSVILMITLFYKALILQGEIWCWSILGRKGLNYLKIFQHMTLSPQRHSRTEYSPRLQCFFTISEQVEETHHVIKQTYFWWTVDWLLDKSKGYSKVFTVLQSVLDHPRITCILSLRRYPSDSGGTTKIHLNPLAKVIVKSRPSSLFEAIFF